MFMFMLFIVVLGFFVAKKQTFASWKTIREVFHENRSTNNETKNNKRTENPN